MSTTNLYFFWSRVGIKIGVSKDVRRRFGDISRMTGASLANLGSIPGSYALERFVHDKLAHHRLHGEWFADCVEVRSLIRSLLEEGPISIGFVEPEKKIPILVQRKRTPEEEIETDHKLLALLWPTNGYEEFAAFAEQPVDIVRQWFTGEVNWPRAMRAAFACLIALHACGHEPIKSYLQETEEFKAAISV